MTCEIHPVDLHVGSVIRRERVRLGLSQKDLADHLKKSFQQVQKYEAGSNRVSASVLHSIAEFLHVPVQKFFPLAIPVPRPDTVTT
jgi:transcriptional regulator with XRE-family HTH domain